MKALRLLNSCLAATPAGVVSVPHRIRGWRSCLAPPPANCWHPSGMIHADQAKEVFASYPVAMVSASQAGGLEAISWWLKSIATIPPDHRPKQIRIPEGCQHPDALAMIPKRRIQPCEAAPPAGVSLPTPCFRGCRSFLAQPPANRWHPSGMMHADQAKEVFATYLVPMVSAPQAGGWEAVSRWLRSIATIPPDHRPKHNRIPEGCQL